jgi:hypothetical protein
VNLLTKVSAVALVSVALLSHSTHATICLGSPTPIVRTFCGWVVDNEWRDIPGADLELFINNNGSYSSIAKCTCSLSGYFEVKDLKPGRYLVQVNAAGYGSYKKDIEIVSSLCSKSKKLVYFLGYCEGVNVLTERQLRKNQKEAQGDKRA